MSRKQARQYRRERSEEIVKLQNLLNQSFPSFDPYGSLKAAAGQCKSDQLPWVPDWDFPTSHTSWGYQCDELIFPLYQSGESSELQPADARDNDVKIKIDLTLVGRSDARRFEDPLFVLEMDFGIEGKGENGDLFGAWHLDKHKGNDSNTARSVHPEYHMQYGGKNLWSRVENYGDMIIPEPPRLSHPPMDLILAVDFVLSNFFWREWRELRNKSIYIDLVSTAQERLWKP